MDVHRNFQKARGSSPHLATHACPRGEVLYRLHPVMCAKAARSPSFIIYYCLRRTVIDRNHAQTFSKPTSDPRKRFCPIFTTPLNRSLNRVHRVSEGRKSIWLARSACLPNEAAANMRFSRLRRTVRVQTRRKKQNSVCPTWCRQSRHESRSQLCLVAHA